ncbi:vWA domain-containing protein [Glaciecola sp. 1036]|uniref:vWA domain-containing protein n=1 Tax=Alteromonadaceae TaxID=72275 RepID=UPI003D0296D2
MSEFTDFHFLRPLALIGILILPIFSYLLLKVQNRKTAWRSLVPTHLQAHLLSESSKQGYKAPFWMLAFVWIVCCIALAGPTWEKLPQPVYQSQTGKVVLMDMSLSMRSTDVNPDRLTRAKFKALDLIERIDEGEIGLVAYAGDAFVISPLTQDIENIENLLPSLSPEIMPVLGSNPFAGLHQAAELLANAGYTEGDIYWITDGIEYPDVELVQEFMNETSFRLSVLLVGTEQGAPIKLVDGTLLKDNRGNIVLPKVNSRYLTQAFGNKPVKLTEMTTNTSDIERMILSDNTFNRDVVASDEEIKGDVWRDMGAFLALAILPFALWFFRKGVLFSLIFVISFLSSPEPAYADESDALPKPELGIVDKMFLNNDQKGVRQYYQQDYETAQESFDRPDWKAAAAYKAGDYETALSLYEGLDGIENTYNAGNALAQLGRLQDAIDAYDKVLSEQPSHVEAMENKKIVESMMQQQEQENQQNQDQNDQGQENQSGEQQQRDENQQGQQDQQNSDQSSSQQNENQNSDSQQQESNAEQQENSSNSEQQNNSSSEQEGEQESELEKEQQQNAEQPNSEQQQEPINNPDSVIQGQVNPEDMTPEEREKMRQMQMLMNRVPDDPAFLLKRKMLLEAQSRRQQRAPSVKEQTW